MISHSKEARSLRATVVAIAVTVAIFTAIAIPAGYVFVRHSAFESALLLKATLKANRVAKYIYAHSSLWQYQTVRLAELIEIPEAEAAGDRQSIVDKSGRRILTLGAQPQDPVMARSAPVVVRGEVVAHVEVAASARPLVESAALVLLISGLLALAVYFAVRIFPLRVLDRALSSLKKTQDTLKTQNGQFDTALNNMTQGLVMYDADNRVEVVNDRYFSMFDASRDIVRPGCTLQELIQERFNKGHLFVDPAEYTSEVATRFRMGEPFDAILKGKDGREVLVASVPRAEGGWVITYEDISERRRAEAKLSHMALHDALTELPNRLFFREQMETRLAHLSRESKFAVLCLDLDRFKVVNDTLGHPFGDKLLRQAAARMKLCLREGDMLARLGGDEFAVLQAGVADAKDTNALAARLIEVMSVPFDLDGQQAIIGASVGISLAPTDSKDPDQLLKSADMALYRAKADGRGTFRFFETEMDARMQARRTMELDLRKALAAGEFELYYQPLITLETKDISGFEALVRWNHPTRGLVAPLDFIPLAEETGLIIPIGEWILRQACADAVQWPDHVSVAVNLSPAQFKMQKLVETVMSALSRSGLPAQRLELEITESLLLTNSENTLETLHQLRALGVRISMDDFGTGYSSLSYLRSFPFDKIKIDRSFIHDLGESGDSQAIIRAVTGLGSSLGMATTGEGVETLEEMEFLWSQGCTQAQGYFFGVPKPARDALALFPALRATPNAAVA